MVSYTFSILRAFRTYFCFNLYFSLAQALLLSTETTLKLSGCMLVFNDLERNLSLGRTYRLWFSHIIHPPSAKLWAALFIMKV